jgi:predicted RNase H-like HicB family nuclease
MTSDRQPSSVPTYHLVAVRPEPPGQYTAQVLSLPAICATAATEEEAIAQVRRVLAEWLATARWVQIDVPVPTAGHPLLKFAGHAKEDPDFEEYLEEIRRYRQEVDEREWPHSSSTPTT